MDDDDAFEDLLADVEMFEGSSQESLTNAATNLALTSRDAGGRLQALLDVEMCDDGEGDSGLAPYSALQEFQLDCVRESEHNQPMSMAFIPSPSTAQSKHTPQSLSMLQKIDLVFQEIASDLSSSRKELSVAIQSRKASATGNGSVPKSRRVCFPGKTAGEAWRFTVVVRILELIHEALDAGVVLSKRDIYYRDPALFGKQAVVDRYIDDIACTFDVPRSQLNVTAAAKGLVVGSTTLTMKGGGMIDLSADREGTLVPNLKDVLFVGMSHIKWILVVEKEASFRSIASSGFWQDITTEGIMLTGKGYPDIATRALLHFLSSPTPRNGFASPSVYGLVDFDPDGLAILSIYKHGSLALAHENEGLRVPELRWFGLRFEDVRVAGGTECVEQSLMTLTSRDRRKAVKMLERVDLVEDDNDLTQALQTMLMLDVKAEIQILDHISNGLTTLLNFNLCG